MDLGGGDTFHFAAFDPAAADQGAFPGHAWVETIQEPLVLWDLSTRFASIWLGPQAAVLPRIPEEVRASAESEPRVAGPLIYWPDNDLTRFIERDAQAYGRACAKVAISRVLEELRHC